MRIPVQWVLRRHGPCKRSLGLRQWQMAVCSPDANEFDAWQFNGCFGSNASISERNTDSCSGGSWVYAIEVSA